MRVMILIGALMLSCSSETSLPAAERPRGEVQVSPDLANLTPVISGAAFRGREVDVVGFKERLIGGQLDPVIILITTDVHKDDDLQLRRLEESTGASTVRVVISDDVDFALRSAQFTDTPTLIINRADVGDLTLEKPPAPGLYLFADGGENIWHSDEEDWKLRSRELRSVLKVMAKYRGKRTDDPPKVARSTSGATPPSDALSKVQPKGTLPPAPAPPKNSSQNEPPDLVSKPSSDSGTSSKKNEKNDAKSGGGTKKPEPAPEPEGPVKTTALKGTATALAAKPGRAQLISALVEPKGNRGVLVNIWATWCVPCVKEMPEIIAISHEYRSVIRYVGLLTEQNDPEVRKRLDKICTGDIRKSQYSLADARMITQLVPERRGQGLEQNAVPIFALFDRKGRLVLTLTETIAAPAVEKKLRAAIEALASEGQAIDRRH